MVSFTIPEPGPDAVFTSRYPSDKVPPAGVIPSKDANCGSGLKAIRVPPAFTQFVRSVTLDEESGNSPNITTSWASSTAGVTNETSIAVKSLWP